MTITMPPERITRQDIDSYKRRGLRLLVSELREYVRAMKGDRDRWRE